ncbi:MAG: NAD+ synthase [Verrucomicrobia bacterium]|nr:MAG: NAD+ synthase [Verrucomicrobiota bacterium]
MKIALAQINTTVGDFAGNEAKILAAYRRGAGAGVELVVFPELATTGYPPRDLLLKGGFIKNNLALLDRLAAATGRTGLLVGYVGENTKRPGREATNSVGLLQNGRIVATRVKMLLPTYDVFDEDRYFEPATENAPVEFNGQKIGVTICEDVWNDDDFWRDRRYRRNPAVELVEAGGCSLVFNAAGGLIARGEEFAEDFLVVDTGTTELVPPRTSVDEEKVFKALVLGLRDYIHKCGFKSVVLGLSGGIDSALTACLAAAALGAENVRGVSLPSQYSSQGSLDDARALAERLGIQHDVISIQLPFEAIRAQLKEIFRGRAEDTTEENIQARLRGVTLMALSNKFGSLLLTTGNKSELAVGYCTLYGDMCGGLAVISDVPKTMVYRLSRWINRDKEIIPAASITKPPSAELRPNQTDQDSLPPYDVLDAILEAYVVQGRSAAEIIAGGFDEATVKRVVRLIDLNEYKRRQAAPGLKVTSKAFGVGRRIPIAQRYREV